MWARRWIPSWQVWWGMGGATASGAAIRRVSGGAGQDLGRIGQPFATAALDSWRAFILTPSLDATGKEAHAQVRDRDPATGKIRDIAFKGIIRKVSLLPTIQACHCVHDRWLHSAAFPPLPHCRSPPLLQADSRGEMQSLEWYQASDGEDMVRPVEPAPSSEAVSRSYAAPEAPVSAHADRSEEQGSTSASLAASGRFLRQGAHCRLLGDDPLQVIAREGELMIVVFLRRLRSITSATSAAEHARRPGAPSPSSSSSDASASPSPANERCEWT